MCKDCYVTKNKNVKYIKNISHITDGETKEEVTMCSEFIPSFDNWITLEEQKKRAKHLSFITKEDIGNC